LPAAILLDHTTWTGEGTILPCCCLCLALDVMTLMTTKDSNNPLIVMPTIAGARMPFGPCLEMPNKATIPRIKPMTTSQSAADATSAIIFRAIICLPNIKSTKIMMVMMGQTQLSLAAWCENDVVFGGVAVSILVCGLTPKLRHRHRSLTLAAMMVFEFHKLVNCPARWRLPAAIC
jgi:hypothetical protein